MLLPEGSPTDSQALEQAFHSHGINMRYLGFIHEKLGKQEEKTQFLQDIVEKEILIRSLKHVINEWIRETSDNGLNETIAHAFNLIFSPTSFIKKLENGQIVYKEEAQDE